MCVLFVGTHPILYSRTSNRSENTLVRGGVGTQFTDLYTAVDTSQSA
jgi:hypothetical protein